MTEDWYIQTWDSAKSIFKNKIAAIRADEKEKSLQSAKHEILIELFYEEAESLCYSEGFGELQP
jgi:hypothetical protein